jgi:hypothetical protein
MTSFDFRKKILISLLSLAIILVAVKIFLQDKNSFNGSNDNSFNESEIRQRFSSILDDFSIDNKLIKEKRVKDKTSGLEISNFKIQVPKDLTIPEILAEVYQSFRKDSLKINSSEKVKGGRTIVSINSGKAAILQCELDYSKTYYRNKGYVSFIIKDFDPNNSTSLKLLENSEKLNILLRPGSGYLEQIEIIQSRGQQFSVLIDDNIGEQKYKLDPSHSEVRVITVIKTLVTDFQKAVCFVADDNSSFYKSENYEVLKRELSKRKIKLLSNSDFINLNDDEGLQSEFDHQIESINPGGSKIFLLEEETFFKILPDMKRYKMKGYRFIASSLILQN